MQKKRLLGLDVFRGIAILLMILYHFIYDLDDFGLISLEMNSTLSILIFRYTIITMFLLTVGVSLALVHQKAINYTSVKKRILTLGASASLVSLSTYVLFPEHWIYFGILHFILVASILTLPLLKYPKITLLLILIIFLGWLTDTLHLTFLYNLLQAPLNLPLDFSLDRIPLFPWWAVVLLGTVLVQYKWHEKLFKLKLFNHTSKLHHLLKIMGQNALVIYLVHQPILLFFFYIFFKIME
ncbi:MAG TPA: DUF1624 domain-containing protein [Campylobacterales bacterium]|nr:DUF1624 domain-containing protein [Campylobacterales bacterium]HHS92237.1 DUF1624 domain-containing protein [Campylobacterales bacterium]